MLHLLLVGNDLAIEVPRVPIDENTADIEDNRTDSRRSIPTHG
jgi:hypothetical protein